jgi:Zn-finger nucleic acid-binding protein
MRVVDMLKKKDKNTGEELLLCPRCKKHMKKLKKDDVIIDVCKKCGGTWADAGELEKLADINKLRVRKK